MDTNFERELLNYLYHDLNRMMQFVGNEIFEFDVQCSIDFFLRFKLQNANYKISREKNGKVDHVIENKSSNKSSLLEVKSFIKKNEKIKYDVIKADIDKTFKKINENKNSEGYLILITKQSHLKSTNKKSIELIRLLTGTKQIFYFDKVKTRLLKSYITMYKNKTEFVPHNSQLRVFMFQILIDN